LEFFGEKLVIKMWETLAENGIGSLLRPWQTKREGFARNEVRRNEMLMLAQAENDAKDILAGRKQLGAGGALLITSNADHSVTQATNQLNLRIEPTLLLSDAVQISQKTDAFEGARREINSAKAVLYAEAQLADDPQEPPIRNIEEDWLFSWREYAGRVGAEDLQRLWGSVLAGEIKSPGRYSIRTLEFLKTLSKAEAELISRLARYSIDGRIARNQKVHLEAKGVSFGLLLKMQNMGIVSGVEAVSLNTIYKSVDKDKFICPLRSNGKVLIIEHADATKTLQLEVYLLTEIGQQILGLGTFEADLEYLNLVGKHIITLGFTVNLCDWRQVSENEGEYYNEVRIVV